MQTLKKNTDKTLQSISIACFLQTRLFTEKFLQTSPIHLGIFLGRALWTDIVSFHGRTLSRHAIKFKPVRAGENLVADYKK